MPTEYYWNRPGGLCVYRYKIKPPDEIHTNLRLVTRRRRTTSLIGSFHKISKILKIMKNLQIIHYFELILRAKIRC